MDVEARLLLYSVVLGAAVGLVQLLHRRAYDFRAYMAELAVLLAVSSFGLLAPSWTKPLAWPCFWAFVAVAIAPSALLEAARRAARVRRYGIAWTSATTGALLLGDPAPLRREAALYGAMAAAEAGDEDRCRARLERVARRVGIPPELGGEALVRVLPAAARRKWVEVLAALDGASYRPPALLAVEVRAAGDTGDLRRALRACREIEVVEAGSATARSSARRALLAAAGRATFLEDAAHRRLPVLAGPPGTAELAVGRAREALGDVVAATAAYDAARRAGRGGVRMDAVAGGLRCAEGRLLVATIDELETAEVLDVEAACRAERPTPEEVPLWRRAPFTLGVSVATLIATALVFTLLGRDTFSLVAAGALSKPLIAGEQEWWRLGSAMLLHGSWFHLAMNLAAILFVGIPLESRLGPSRTAIVYLGSGFLASAASVFAADTQVGVGASGAAMGLIGALCVLLLRRAELFGDAERRRWLGALGITIVAEMAVGFAESEFIDNTAHGGGFLAGVLIGWLLLPATLEGASHAAFRRLAALALVGVMADCAWVTVSNLKEWRGERVATTRGARATLPAWMRARPVDGGLVLRREPLVFAVQLDAEPAAPRPELLLPDEPELRERFAKFLAAGPTASRRAWTDHGGSFEAADYLDAGQEGFRTATFRRGGAFALVLYAVEPGDDGAVDRARCEELAVRIGTSLGAVE